MQKWFRVCGLGLLVLLLPGAAMADERREQVDRLFAAWDKPDSPGCALGVIHKGQFLYRRGYGMANLEHRVPLASNTVFYIASTSKQFAAASVALLVAQGKLSLDDDVRRYVPELPDYGQPITIRHLIHHTSGLRDYLSLWELAGRPFENVFTRDDVLALVARQKRPNFPPGEQFLYSNTGYFLLSVIVERVSGKSLRAFAEENFFRPLGMVNTHFHDDRTMVVANRAAAYSPAREGGFRLNWLLNFDQVGDGGLLTTVDDLFRWDQNFYQNRLPDARLDLWQTPGRLASGEPLHYAFGLLVGTYKGLRFVSHAGGFMGFRTEMIRFPEQEFSAIVLCNLSSANPVRLARRVADIYLADQLRQTDEPFVELPEAELADKAGTYRNLATGQVIRLEPEGGKLRASAGRLRYTLAPLSSTRFRTVDAPFDLDVSFERARPGAPWQMRLDSGFGVPPVLEQFQPVSPAPAELDAYVGDYYSEELDATYKLVRDADKLCFRHRNAPEGPLEPTRRDEFAVPDFSVVFERDARGRLTGFVLTGDRVRGVRFARRPR